MHEYWLQRFIKEHYSQIGFTEIHGPYKNGADFKGFYFGKLVKIEAEWNYSDFIDHQHPVDFADVLIVATYAPVPENLRERLPSKIIHLNREQVITWALPRRTRKNKEDYYAYSWRRLSRSLLDLYAYYRKQAGQGLKFLGSGLALSKNQSPTPAGFLFGSGGKEAGFSGSTEDKAVWDYWLIIAHSVASQFHLKPALLHPTWIDRIALYFNHTDRITDGEFTRFNEIAEFIGDIILRGEP
jgi:hypothetical protein